MANTGRTALLTLVKLSDLAVVSLAIVVALYVGLPDQRWSTILEMRVKLRNVLFLATYLGYWHVVLRTFGLYGSYRLSPVSREWSDVGKAVLLAVIPLLLVSSLLRFEYATPTFFACFAAVAFCGITTERRACRVLARSMRRHGRNLRNVIIVGDGDSALETASRLARRADLGYYVVEIVGVEPAQLAGNGTGAAVLDRVSGLVASRPIDEVFVAVPLDTGQPLIRGLVGICEEQGITVRLVSSVVDLVLARAQVDEVDGRPVLTVFTGPPDSLLLTVKRLIDVVVSLAVLGVLAPAFVVLAIAIKLDSHGPMLFIQERVGLGGRRFRFYKFRTMVMGAEKQQQALEPLNEAHGPIFKIRNDPRVTRVGRWIRRLSLDELPQLVNVFIGNMSLVGPRPLPERDVQLIEVRAQKRRFSVKPGITCLWQINGREPTFEEWVRMDMEYIDNWSLGLDLKILAKTIPAVLSGRGAY